MNKYVKEYLRALEETLSEKYSIPLHKAKMIIQDSYVIECLRDYTEESLHEDIESVADIIYGDYIEKRGVKMRDKNRISEFTKELERIWMQYYPDWRFGQLMVNFLNYVVSEHNRDPFFPEESEMLKYLKEYERKSLYYKEL